MCASEAHVHAITAFKIMLPKVKIKKKLFLRKSILINYFYGSWLYKRITRDSVLICWIW